MTALTFRIAAEDDIPALAALRTSVAGCLTEEFGKGHWSSPVSEKGQRFVMTTSRIVIACCGDTIIGTLRMATKKPWAIDITYFTAVRRALYLLDMAVHPDFQRRGIGRALLHEAVNVAKAWPAQAIRLDAYDSAAGAGAFYAKCGFRETGRVVYRKVPLIYFEYLC